jgi:hypothetical protein
MKDGIATDLTYGTWDPLDIPINHWPAWGTTRRLDQSIFTSGPGPCGSQPMGKPVQEDCSPTRVRHWNLILQYDKTDENLQMNFDPVRSSRNGAREKPFDSCPLEPPPGADGDTVSTVEVPFSSSELLAVDGKHVVVAHHVWSYSGVGFKETTTVDWRMTLVRHQ